MELHCEQPALDTEKETLQLAIFFHYEFTLSFFLSSFFFYSAWFCERFERCFQINCGLTLGNVKVEFLTLGKVREQRYDIKRTPARRQAASSAKKGN